MFSYEEVFAASKEYFNGNELAANIFANKYCLQHEGKYYELTPDDMHRRMAKEFARIESKKFKKPYTEEEIYQKFKGFKKIVPQGSPMFGIGNPYQLTSLSNCFVVDSPLDSYGSICKTDEEIVQISKRRGGIGYDISNIRPETMKVNNAARTTTGAVSFMHRFSNTGREVGQGGRRAAQMISISVHHPDIEKFIAVKADDVSVTGANISVRLTNEFLEAVEQDKDFELRWPVESKTPKISKMVSAKALWQKIIHYAWLRAEPGLLFWDNIIKNCPANYYHEFGFLTISTNPCLPRWARLRTKDGLRLLRELSVGDEIWSKEGWTKITNIQENGFKTIFKYKTTFGTFYSTENHQVVSKGVKIPVKDCDSIDILTGPNEQLIKHDYSIVMDGIVFGDGSVHKASNDLIYLCVGQDDSDYFDSEIKDLLIKHRPGITKEAWEITTSIKANEIPLTYNRFVPDRFIYGSHNNVCSFLRGLYTANGSICADRITLKSSSFRVIESVQLMLSSIGIKSYYTTNKAKNVEFSNGNYECKESYDLNITVDRELFQSKIGFIQKYKNEKLQKIISNKTRVGHEIVNKKITDSYPSSQEDVFNITVDNESSTFWCDGFDISNCGEITLSAYDSCRLLAINLFGYMVNPYTKDAYFNYVEFYKDAQFAQRLMDDLVDLELECIEKIIAKIESDPEPNEVKFTELNLWHKIKKACQDGRRTGLGITGLGDTIAALGYKYGSSQSIAITESIYKNLKLASYTSSVEMAKELGAFPVWSWELEKECPFIQQIEEEQPELFKNIQKYGRRNIANLTTAPTGTLSMLCAILNQFNISSGIEPAFMLSYDRMKKGNPNDEGFKTDYVDQSGDHWMKFKIYHSGHKLWMDISGETDETKSPYYGACADDLKWTDRVALQAAAQRHIDHSISSTINLPEDISEEEVAKIYEAAWKLGCKGVTVYRKNCRTGVLVESKEENIPRAAVKRPDILPCDIFETKIKGAKYFVIVGLMDDSPYEIFAGRLDFFLQNNESGFLKRTSRGKYQLQDKSGEIIEANICDYLTDNEQVLTRLVSTALRHNTPLEFLVHQIDKADGDLSSSSKVICRILKKYIKEGTKITGTACPECKQETLVRSSGCNLCTSCGFSACS